MQRRAEKLLVGDKKEPDYSNEFVQLTPFSDPSSNDLYVESYRKVAVGIFQTEKMVHFVLDSDKRKPIGPIKVRFDQIVEIQQARRERFGAIDVTTIITAYPDFESLSVWDVVQGLYRNLRAALAR